ncbi:MAG: hypothetical protein LBU64_09075, partial [Planctomycetota bacterium]|nr:hypothetical protein [Planctomycetota bacterium]
MLDTAHPARPDSGGASRFFPPDSLAGRTRDGATLLVTAAGVDTIVIPGLALLMANIAAYSGMASFSLRPDTGARMIPMVGALLTGCLLGGALFPRLLAWAMSGEGALRKAAPLAWIAAAPAVVLAGLQHYVFNEPLRVFANLFTGMAIATAYQLFFSRFPASRRGACFGVCLGAGLLCWNLLISLAQIMPKEEHAAFHPALVHVYHVHAAALVLLAALCSYSLILRPAALPPQKPCFAPSQGKTGWRSPVRAFMSIAVVVYFLNGILGGKLTPSFLTPPWLVPHILLRILVAGAACGAGWLMDERPAPLFRRVLHACCWLFVLAPAL